MKVTDHAVLRYMERLLNVDVERVRQAILDAMNTPRSGDTFSFVGDASCRITVDGVTYCVRGGAITTCYPHRSR